MKHSLLAAIVIIFVTASACGPEDGNNSTEPAIADANAVVFSMSDKYTLLDDGPGTVVLAGTVQTGVLRPGDSLEILDGGPDTRTTIRLIRVGVPSVEVDSLAAGEFGNLLVNGELDDFTFTQQLVRPTE
jgi:GTPase